MHFMNSDPARKYAFGLCFWHHSLASYVCRSFGISLHYPCHPLTEQQRLVEYLEEQLSFRWRMNSKLRSCLQAAGSTASAKSILKWAFEGKLADQDPNDEPASALLERIKAEREAKARRKSKPNTRKKRNGRKTGAPHEPDQSASSRSSGTTATVLRDDGLSYQDYLEQLTFLLFLKMAEERATITRRGPGDPQAGYRWADLSPTRTWRATTPGATTARPSGNSACRAACSA